MTEHPMKRAGDLVDLAYTYQEDGAFFMSAKKLREAADLIEQHARESHLVLLGLTTHELEVLRILNGEQLDNWVAGAAMWECAGALKGKGYAEGMYTITDKGRELLKFLGYEKPAQDPPTWDAYMAAARALNWRNAELRFYGFEPIKLPTDAPQYPPADFDFGSAHDEGECQ